MFLFFLGVLSMKWWKKKKTPIFVLFGCFCVSVSERWLAPIYIQQHFPSLRRQSFAGLLMNIFKNLNLEIWKENKKVS